MSETKDSTKKPNCYECAHRRQVIGSAHSACAHPDTAAVREDPMAQLIGLMGRRSGLLMVPGIERAAAQLHIRAAGRGIDRGWFLWPMNFDPVWLEWCDGYAPVATATEVQS